MLQKEMCGTEIERDKKSKNYRDKCKERIIVIKTYREWQRKDIQGIMEINICIEIDIDKTIHRTIEIQPYCE